MPEWDLQTVLRALTKAPYDSIETATFRDLSLKTFFQLALVSTKRVSEIHALLTDVRHASGWTSVSFHYMKNFVCKSQDPSKFQPKFES